MDKDYNLPTVTFGAFLVLLQMSPIAYFLVDQSSFLNASFEQRFVNLLFDTFHCDSQTIYSISRQTRTPLNVPSTFLLFRCEPQCSSAYTFAALLLNVRDDMLVLSGASLAPQLGIACFPSVYAGCFDLLHKKEEKKARRMWSAR